MMGREPEAPSTPRQSAESFYCWPSLLAAFGDLLLELRELLLNVGWEVGYVTHSCASSRDFTSITQ